jgi:DNA-binding transcriptional LysR family regulator
MFSVHQLNVFTTAAELLNFTLAAKRLHMTQSSVSQHIKNLETQLDTDLFVRKGRSLELTDAGKYFLPLARDIVQDSIRAEEKMLLLKEKVHGHLIIGCNTAPGKYILPHLLAEFHKRHPLVQITCTVRPQSQIIQQLSEGDVHFAMLNLDDEEYDAAEFLSYLREPIHLIVPTDHPWALLGEIEPEDLYEANFIMREETSGTYKSVRTALGGVGINVSKLKTYLEMGTAEAIALAVQEGLGFGFVSQMIIEKICPHSVATVRIRGVNIVQDIYMGRQNRQPATPAQTAFWDFIRSIDTYSYLPEMERMMA